MDKFKPIISHQEGQNLFPGIPTVIKGDKSSTNITMKNTKDQIALTPYGASYMTPGQDYAFAGNTVAELPMAQMGGEDPEQDQIMQILQVYAQMKQIPIEELMQQLQSLPEEQQQQALSSIVQDVQKTMQEQQMGQQQQPEMGQQDQQGMMEQEMGMARHGGEPCIDCEEQFPQAQNLNWFYKAEGGEAFPQANPYPHMYAQGGEAFPQAQTYLPYDRGGNPVPNFMFQQGGLYDYTKSLGLDPSYESRKKMFSKYFNEKYTGTAEQNTYLLNALKSGKIKTEGVRYQTEKPKLNQPASSRKMPSFDEYKKEETKSQNPQTKYQYRTNSDYISAPKDATSTQSPYMQNIIGRSAKTSAPVLSKDKRQIPQTGVVIDKRTGEAIVLGDNNAMRFPVLTGMAGPDANATINTTIENLAFDQRSTPRGYYFMNKDNIGDHDNTEYHGNISRLLPISAYDTEASQAYNLAMHETYDPAYREQFYNMSPEERYRTYGCVNCQQPSYEGMMQTLNNQNDTAFIVDSKLQQDASLWNQAQKQLQLRSKDPRNQYTSTITERELGGSTDIDQAYQMMKRGGFDMNPKKKKGGKFDAGSFQDYVMKNGGYLPKHQFEEATVGQNLSQPSGSYNTWGSPTITNAVSQSPAFQQVQDYNANATRIADQNVVKQGTDQMGDKPSNLTYPKQNPKTSMYNLFSPAFSTKPKRQNVVGAGLKALASAVDFGGSMYNGKGLFPAQQGGLPKHQSEGPVRFQQTPSVNWSSEILDDGQLSYDELGNAYNNSWNAYNNSWNYYEDQGISGAQSNNSTTGVNMPKTPNPISQFKPQTGPWNNYNTGTMTNDINSVINEPMTLKKNQSFFGGQDAQGNSIYNFDKIPDTGITSNQQQQQQQKRGVGFNTPFAARQVSNLNNIGGFLQGINELKAEDKELAKGINSSAWMPVQQSNDRGDYMNNNGMFRPNDYQYSQSAPGMQNQQAFYAQAGGPLDMFEDGEEYDLDENTINLILAMGGSVEYL
jgi:hypothetical protein